MGTEKSFLVVCVVRVKRLFRMAVALLYSHGLTGIGSSGLSVHDDDATVWLGCKKPTGAVSFAEEDPKKF